MKIYKFGNCQLNTLERSVLKDGQRIELTPRTFDVLQMLVENAGDVVTKDQILGKVWDGSFVEESNLPVHISKLRRALNENSAERYIETVVGSGYRFISTVQLTEINDLETGSTTKTITESHRMYLKAKLFERKETLLGLRKAISYLQNSISLDPVNIDAYIDLMRCYQLLYTRDYITYAEAQQEIERYVKTTAELGSDNDRIQSLLGEFCLTFNWNFSAAESYFQTALSLNPTNLTAHQKYVQLLIFSCRFAEALGLMKQMMLLNPLSVNCLVILGRAFYLMGLYETALTHLNEAIELDERNYIAFTVTGSVHLELQDYRTALSYFEKSHSLQKNLGTKDKLGETYALMGQKASAAKVIREIRNEPGNTAIKVARIYAALKEKDETYDCLERAFDEHEFDLLGLRVDPSWKTIREERRFEALVKKVGIP